MNASSTGQTLALAGLVQSAYLVDRIAQTGQASPEDIEPLVHSLFQFDADSPFDVYGGKQALQLGFGVLDDLLGGDAMSQYRATLRYSMSIVYLQSRLTRQPELLKIIHNRLQHAAVNRDHFSSNINNIASNIAAVYQDTVSTLSYRLQVTGSAQQLQLAANADLIRALLLAGIRSALLWRQSGGKRWHLLFSKKRLRHTLANLSSN